jgi:hypothetical protein
MTSSSLNITILSNSSIEAQSEMTLINKGDDCNNSSNGDVSPPVDNISHTNGYNNNFAQTYPNNSPNNMAYKKSFRIDALLGKNQNSFDHFDENGDISDHKYISLNDGLLKYDDDNKDYDMSPEERLSR